MPARAIRPLSAIIALALLAAGCYVNPSPPNLTPIPTLAPGVTPAPVAASTAAPTAAPRPSGAAAQGDAQDGMKLFAQNCASCHGQNAQGVPNLAPALRNNAFVKAGPQAKVFEVIANGRSGTAMPAWSQAKGGRLTDAQIDNLVAYVLELQR